jgi:hypothetical protein
MSGLLSAENGGRCRATKFRYFALWGTVQTRRSCPYENIAMGGTPMPQTWSPIIERLKTGLRAQYDAIVNEPMPERWVDLIKRLNEQERGQGETGESKAR